MAGKFFITGLPRSRTAWCANFMTAGDAFCYHDGLANCRTLDDFARKMDAHPVSGDSDSGLVFFVDELRDRYPDAQWAVLRRDPAEVVRSLVSMPPYQNLPRIEEDAAEAMVAAATVKLDKLAAEPGVLSVRVEELSTREGARALWWHCLRDRVPWETARWEMLRDLRVTVASERVNVSVTAAAALFGRAA